MRKIARVGRRVSSLFVVALHLFATLGLADEPVSSEPALGLIAVDPLTRGLSLYREGEYRRAAEALETARRERPSDAEAALLLGLTELRLDDPADAARQWRDAIRLADARWAGDLRRSLTLVAREADRRDARVALAPNATTETDDERIAVLPFRAEKSTELLPLARALSTFLATNLGGIPDGSVVDPDRVDVFLAESGDAASADAAAARRVARALGAGRFVIGSLEELGASPTLYRLEAHLFESASERESGRFDAEAAADDFHTLVPTVAGALAERLGGARESVGAEHTRNAEAAAAFGRGRELFAKDDFPAARDELERAVQADEELRLAQELLERLPATAVSLIAVGNSVESAVMPTLAEAKGGGGLSGRTLLLLGGAAVAAGAAGIALAVGGGGGGGGDGDGGGAPTLEGVQDGNVTVGQVFRLDVTGRDPDGSDVTLEADLSNVQPGATFTILSDTGAAKTGRLEYRPAIGDAGVHTVRFTVRVRDDASRSASATARITVTGLAASTPTPGITPGTSTTPTATRTRTPTPTPTVSPTP